MQSLTQINDLSPDQISEIMKQSFQFKTKKDKGILDDPVLKGKVVAMIFEKASLRTKVAFEVATASLGGIPVYLTSSQILASGQNESGRESVPDIGKNLERFADLIMARVYDHDTILTIKNSIQKPVINLLCDKHHPTQALADLMAIQWHFPKAENIKVAFIGDGNNVAASLMQICVLIGIHFSIASPEGYTIPLSDQELALQHAAKSGSKLSFVIDPYEAVKDADVIYTDTFISMGQEAEKQKRLQDFHGYQVDMKLLQSTGKYTVFMHCLPAHRGEEVTDEVMDCAQSIVFDQAECRLHIAKALMIYFLS